MHPTITIIYSLFITASYDVFSGLYTSPCFWNEEPTNLKNEEPTNLKKLEGLMALYGSSCGHCEVSGLMGDRGPNPGKGVLVPLDS